MPADFKRAAFESARLLLSQRLYNLRIDVKSLKYSKNIIFSTFADFCRASRLPLKGLAADEAARDGCTIIKKRNGETVYIVLYNDDIRSQGRQNFTLAHEIGHIYLGHEDDCPDFEAEANHFAASLILPPVLCWNLFAQSQFKLTASELAEVFIASKAAAENRLKSFAKKTAPEFSAEEQKLYKKFGGLLPQLDGPIITIM